MLWNHLHYTAILPVVEKTAATKIFALPPLDCCRTTNSFYFHGYGKFYNDDHNNNNNNNNSVKGGWFACKWEYHDNNYIKCKSHTFFGRLMELIYNQTIIIIIIIIINIIIIIIIINMINLFLQ